MLTFNQHDIDLIAEKIFGKSEDYRDFVVFEFKSAKTRDGITIIKGQIYWYSDEQNYKDITVLIISSITDYEKVIKDLLFDRTPIYHDYLYNLVVYEGDII